VKAGEKMNKQTTPETLKKDRETAITAVGWILRAQYDNNFQGAQDGYQKLRIWCESKGYDFNDVFHGAQKILMGTAVGLHDTLAYAGVMKIAG
jgi:hypothetical protein